MAEIADLSLARVTKRFGAHVAVDAVDFSAARGAFFSILGPSGCGKTTLMRMIAGFEMPSEGDIAIRGASMAGVPANRRPVNMVFQNLALFPTMTVGENVAYGLDCRGVARGEREARVRRILGRVGLADFIDRRVTQLSGGQRQRVAIARCLVLEPTILLLDEPLGALDLKLREHMKIELKRLQADFNTTFVYITHDQSEALVMSDQVAVMNRGRFEQVGSPRELYRDPASAFVAGFVGDANRWPAEFEAPNRVRLSGGATVAGRRFGPPSAGPATCFVRPESVALAPSAEALSALENRYSGKVVSVLFDGANSTLLVRADAGGFELRATLPQTGALAGVEKGAAVHFGWSAEAARIFAA
ncbi:MAG: ATP-binding cassette domain-containing protein [Alphaproteobacteria bacterium]|nr:ATP-binding cassette domain-containing protein [Alphaproteobacteria bacterium]